MKSGSRTLSAFKAGVRATLRKVLSQERRTELKRIQSLARKRLAPVRSFVHGTFSCDELVADLSLRLPREFEILMVHSSYEGLLPMFKGTPAEIVAALIKICGPGRTLVMPAWVMGGRTFDTEAYFRTRPFDVRRTPSEVGLLAEVFRRTPGVVRSLHPTCSVCALGPLSKELTAGHHLALGGLGPDGPFGVMTRRPTAILGVGIEYYRCLTHVHTAKAELGESFPIKFSEASKIPIMLVDYDGTWIEYRLWVPDPLNKPPQPDLRVLWSLLSKDELVEWNFHGSPMFVLPRAGVVTERLIEAARRGITVYGRVPASELRLAATPQEATEQDQ